MSRRFRLAVAALAVALAVALVSTASGVSAQTDVDVDPYRGLGVWVDVFDYAPRLQSAGGLPRVTAESMDDIARLGARTVYLQVANPDDVPSTRLVDTRQLRAIVRRAHDNDLSVVAWFLPTVADLDEDEQFVRQIVGFRADGQGFDAIALDIEDTHAVPDPAQRSDRVVELARRARSVMDGDMALGAIVYPAVQLDVVNPALWPSFPYRRLDASIDVWMPMAYFTYRDDESGYRDAFTYGKESVTRLRDHLGDDEAPVHLIGGIADLATPVDYVSLVRAARATDSLGYSVYDYVTTSSSAWPYLRRGLGDDS